MALRMVEGHLGHRHPPPARQVRGLNTSEMIGHPHPPESYPSFRGLPHLDFLDLPGPKDPDPPFLQSKHNRVKTESKIFKLEKSPKCDLRPGLDRTNPRWNVDGFFGGWISDESGMEN